MNMKIIRNWITLLFVGIVLFSSCTEKDSPQLKAIPADAVLVVTLENGSLIKKGGLDNLKEYAFFQKIQKEIAEQDSEVQKFISNLIENPKSSGLDIETSYLYLAKKGDAFYVVNTFKIANLSDLEGNINNLIKSDTDAAIEDKGDYKLIAQNSDFALAWNKEVFFAITGSPGGIPVEDVVSVSGEKNILSVSDFQEFRKVKSDIGLWFSYSELFDLLSITSSAYNDIFPELVKDISGTYAHGYLNFENGEIALKASISPKSKIDELNKKYPIMKAFNNDLLTDFPESSFLAFKFAFNLDEYLKLIKKSIASLDEQSLNEALESPIVQTITNGLGGDFLASIYGFAQGPLPIPLVGISFSVKSEDDFNNLLALVPQDNLQHAGQFYSIGAMGFSVYFAYKDNRVFLTDDSEAITAFTGSGYDKNLKNTSLTDIYKTYPNLLYFNLDLDAYPASIKNLLQTGPLKNAGTALSFLEEYKDITYGTTSNNELVFSFKFKNNKQNALKTLLKSIDKLAANE
jgi:hypothetical protein